MKRSRNVSLQTMGMRTNTLLLVPVVAAAAVSLGGCNEYATLADCESRNGAGKCMQEPRPALMTEENRPSYVVADACMKDFGEEQCQPEERKNGRVYRPIYTPGQTYFYPHDTGYTGYYRGSTTTSPGKYQFVSRYGFGGSARSFGAAAGG